MDWFCFTPSPLVETVARPNLPKAKRAQSASWAETSPAAADTPSLTPEPPLQTLCVSVLRETGSGRESLGQVTGCCNHCGSSWARSAPGGSPQRQPRGPEGSSDPRSSPLCPSHLSRATLSAARNSTGI